MDIVLNSIDDIKKYNPYVGLAGFKSDEYFEGIILDYLRKFTIAVNSLKEKCGHKFDKKIDKEFDEIIKQRNDEEVERILGQYFSTSLNNETSIKRLKESIRQVKDIILLSEPSDMKRLQKVDECVGEVIDKFSISLCVSDNVRFNGFKIDDLLNNFKQFECEDVDEYVDYVISFRKNVEAIYNHYRNNYSVATAVKYIKALEIKVNRLLDDKAIKLGFLKGDEELIDELVKGYSTGSFGSVHFDIWVYEFKRDIKRLKDRFKNIYSDKMSRKIINLLESKSSEVIDVKANKAGYKEIYEGRLRKIFLTYTPDLLNPFDIMFYSSEEERREAEDKYYLMTPEAEKAFEMRIYEQYIRIFKGKIRQLNKDIRRVYSADTANKLVNSVNKRADELIRIKAKKIDMPVPKNPWFVRKYLWADMENFISENGTKCRKFINPVLRTLVKVAMNNKIVMEEQEKLDSTKQYIFVPTHYFTEDAIGMFASLNQQAYMLMGTTDQIENNPLMMAAVFFGFFHVDRMDNTNRKECVEKQNRIIDKGGNFINYVSGSWENSENELQPLSFSGPYRTCAQKDIQIVPVGLYLVREEKKIYVRYGAPLDLSKCDEKVANEIIRDTLASIHFKQMQKHSIPIETIEIEGYGRTHNLPYDQHTYYMDQVCSEYWNQPWSKPFAVEEVGVRRKKVTDEEDVYSFVDDLSRESLIELSGMLSQPLLRRDERERYNIINYIDMNYDRYKCGKKRTRRKNGK